MQPAPSPTLLDSIRVGTPCTASWEAMKGDDVKRFCGDCRLHVYDLSAMRRDEAEALLSSSSGRLCVRFSRRADGRVVTDDCGRVRKALRRRARAIRIAASALLGMFFPLAAASCGRGGATVPPPELLVPTTGTPAFDPRSTMGDYCPPPPQPTPAPQPTPPAPDDPATIMGRRIMGEVHVPPPRQGTTSPEQVDRPQVPENSETPEKSPQR